MTNNFENNSIKPAITPEEFEKMVPLKRNPIITTMVRDEIKKQGIEGRLVFNPIVSGYKPNRKMYYPKAGVSVFEAYLSQLNTLPLAYLEVEVREIVNNAKRHFKII